MYRMKTTPTLVAVALLTACSSPDPEPRVPPSWQAEPVEEPPTGRPGRLEVAGGAFRPHHAGYSFARGQAVDDVDEGDLVLRFDWQHPEGALAATGDQASVFVVGKKPWAELIVKPTVRAWPAVEAVALTKDVVGTAMIVKLRDESLVLLRVLEVTPSTDAQLTAGGKAAVSFEWEPFPARPVSPPDPLPPNVTQGRIVLRNAARRRPMLAGYSFKVMRGDRFDPDLTLYFDDVECRQGAILAAEQTPELYVLGTRTWAELERLTELPTSEPVRKVVPTSDLVGVAMLVRRRRGKFAIVRITEVKPATFAEVNAGKAASLAFEWAPFTPRR